MMPDAQAATSGEGISAGSPERIKVLMYHRIVTGDYVIPGEREFSINAKVFRKHLRILEQLGYTTITFNDFDHFKRGELNLPRKPIIITFDDGYRDTHEHAFPILREYGMKAVVFVVADPRMRMNDWDSGYDITPAPLMTPEQIVELHEAGFEIGSHSLTHPRLTQIPKDAAWEEISRSRMVLEILINAPVRTFSYPYGLNDGLTRQLAKEAGYAYACGVYTGPPAFGFDPYDIRRIAPSVDILPLGFWLQVVTSYQRYDWLKWKTKQLFGGLDGRQNGSPNGPARP
jgi:peptidoglycan/xylan/chitin deacetylase (PgdA/CDA1 family)